LAKGDILKIVGLLTEGKIFMANCTSSLKVPGGNSYNFLSH
jgi:hypothetical protein